MSQTETAHPNHATFHFTVDGDPLSTTEHQLTPQQIMALASIDPSNHFLTLIRGREQESYEGRNDEVIHMHDGLVFISSSTGPTPVS